jgi:hypothetical protein
MILTLTTTLIRYHIVLRTLHAYLTLCRISLAYTNRYQVQDVMFIIRIKLGIFKQLQYSQLGILIIIVCSLANVRLGQMIKWHLRNTCAIELLLD